MPIPSFLPGSLVTLTAYFGVNHTRLAYPAAADDLTIRVRNISGYASANTLMLNPGAGTSVDGDTGTQETLTVSGSPSGNTITLGSVLVYAHAVNEVVMELADPTTVAIIVMDPTGLQTTYTYALATVTRDSLGVFSVSITATVEGTWKWRVASTGTPQAPGEAEFTIATSPFV